MSTLKKLLLAIITFTALPVLADTLTRDSAIVFIINEEKRFAKHPANDGRDEYNWGLSKKYYGVIDSKWKAIEQYRKLWVMTGADRIPDNTMAFIYFDTAILFNEPTAQEFLTNCNYSWRDYLLLRLKRHYEYCHNPKTPWLKSWYDGYVGRIIRLYDRFNKSP